MRADARFAALAAAFATTLVAAGAQAQQLVIPYEGLLESNGEAVNAPVTMNFALFDCEACADPPLWVASLQNPGTIVWPAPTAPGVEVDVYTGRFSTALGGAGQLVLPESLFESEQLYLAVAVHEGGSVVQLAGRQRIVAAPQSVWVDSALTQEEGDALYEPILAPAISGRFNIMGPDYDPMTAILLEGEGGTIVDSSPYQHNIEAFGTATTSGAQAQVGASSIHIGPTVGWMRVAWSSAFIVSAYQDFTIDMWLKLDPSQPSAACERIFQFGEASNGFRLYFCDEANLEFMGVLSTPIMPLRDGSWHHVALTRSNSTLRMFVDGAVVGTASWNGENTLAAPMHFSTYPLAAGSESAYFMNGYLDNFRFIVGRALWTSTFEPPVADLDMTQRVMVIEEGRVVDIE